MFTFQALQILIFLVPGLISTLMLNALIVRKDKNDLGVIVEALVMSMLIYFIFSFFSIRSPIVLNQVNKLTFYSYETMSFFLLIFISSILAAICALFVTNDWHMKIARYLKISRKTSRATVWFDVFYDFRKHIIINFSDERRIYGWPLYYSNEPDSQYIFLYKPAWIKEGEFIDLNISGILITPEQKIESIEFLND